MHNRLALQKLMIFASLIAILLVPLIVVAQGDSAPTGEAVEQAAPTAGLTILILLVGLGAVALVGVRMWLRDNYPGESKT